MFMSASNSGLWIIVNLNDYISFKYSWTRHLFLSDRCFRLTYCVSRFLRDGRLFDILNCISGQYSFFFSFLDLDVTNFRVPELKWAFTSGRRKFLRNTQQIRVIRESWTYGTASEHAAYWGTFQAETLKKKRYDIFVGAQIAKKRFFNLNIRVHTVTKKKQFCSTIYRVDSGVAVAYTMKVYYYRSVIKYKIPLLYLYINNSLLVFVGRYSLYCLEFTEILRFFFLECYKRKQH